MKLIDMKLKVTFLNCS